MEFIVKEDGLVFETENYTVCVGRVWDDRLEVTTDGYVVTNKVTGVREFEQKALPQACLVARRLQEGLDLELSGEAARNELAATSQLIPQQPRRN